MRVFLLLPLLTACAHVQIPPDLPAVTAAIVAEQFAQRNCPRTLAQLMALASARDVFDAHTHLSVESIALVMQVRAQTDVICGLDLTT
jgi:hypothetical protein